MPSRSGRATVAGSAGCVRVDGTRCGDWKSRPPPRPCFPISNSPRGRQQQRDRQQLPDARRRGPPAGVPLEVEANRLQLRLRPVLPRRHPPHPRNTLDAFPIQFDAALRAAQIDFDPDRISIRPVVVVHRNPKEPVAVAVASDISDGKHSAKQQRQRRTICEDTSHASILSPGS